MGRTCRGPSEIELTPIRVEFGRVTARTVVDGVLVPVVVGVVDGLVVCVVM